MHEYYNHSLSCFFNRILLTLFFSTHLSFFIQAHALSIPQLTNPVMDEARMISPQVKVMVSDVLRTLLKNGGSQITLLTLSDLEGLTIEEAALQIVDQWKLGGEKKDNGVLLLIAKKERKIRIEVGQGLEGNLTDAHSKGIIEDSMVPLMKTGNIDGAMILGITQIISFTDPEFDIEKILENQSWNYKKGSHRGNSYLLFLFIFILFIIARFSGNVPLFSRGYSRWGGGYSGGFGGKFGGGWSGGGGGFSGGGASGSW